MKESCYTIYSKPTKISFVCPYCGEEVEIDVNKLLTTNVWEGGCEDCPECGKTINLSWNGKYD